MAVTIS